MRFKIGRWCLLVILVFAGCQQKLVLTDKEILNTDTISQNSQQEFLFTDADLENARVLVPDTTQEVTIQVTDVIPDGEVRVLNISGLKTQVSTVNREGLLCNISENFGGFFKWGIYRHYLSNTGSAVRRGLFGVQEVGRRIQSVDCRRDGLRAVFSMARPSLTAGDDHEIIVVDEGGTPIFLTNDDYEQLDVTMNADGTIVAWNVEVNGKGLIVLWQWYPDGTFSETVFLSNVGFYEPSISHNGEWLVFIDNQESQTNIYRHHVLAGGTTADIVANHPGRISLRHPSISDDGLTVGWMQSDSSSLDTFMAKSIVTGAITEFVSNDSNLNHAQIASSGSAVYSTQDGSSSVTKIINFVDGVSDDLIIPVPTSERYFGATWTPSFIPVVDPPGETGSGSVSVTINDFSQRQPVENVSITVTDSDNSETLDVNVRENPPGTYTISNILADTTINVAFNKASYLEAVISNVNIVEDETVVLEQLLYINESLDFPSSASGFVTNALTGIGLANATVNLRQGIGVSNGPIAASTITLSDGSYSFTNISTGYYTCEVLIDGFIIGYSRILVVGGSDGTNQSTSISPTLDGSEYRIVLSWGQIPNDLDSHLTGPTADGIDRFHVYYSNRLYSESGVDYINLDRDDTDSFGPETTTIIQQSSGIYKYSIHDFSNRSSINSTELSQSLAKVKVFQGSELLREFNVPNGVGNVWNVFELNGAQITTLGTISSDYTTINPQNSINNGTSSEVNVIEALPVKN